MDTGMGLQQLGSTQSSFFGNINTAKGSNPLANLTSGVDTLSLSGKPDIHFGHGMKGKDIEKLTGSWAKAFTRAIRNEGKIVFNGIEYKAGEKIRFLEAKLIHHKSIKPKQTGLK